ncbi:hypothetical protein I316_05463 [Kwoniella heveanensis BCC8398]|uniref:Glycosyl transferase family 1 domain-containing protein n=1 Tax=Kwoniella heveanensis BCC8398 TaxID=1296120 RepID=A0A1B9GP78_9TREE|nr:hypothetical protein I316_05463 [Kwoniella heveanensis BCC8398]
MSAQKQQYLPLSPPQTPDTSLIGGTGADDHEPPSSIPELDLDAVHLENDQTSDAQNCEADDEETAKYAWRKGMTEGEKDVREAWLAGARGRSGLRIVIVTENFLPKVDGVTRTLSRLLEHLTLSGHQCILLGPSSSLSTYASHPLVGTLGIPLVVYPGLKLNFLRPKFLSVIRDWEPDIVHFVDPIWLGAQTILAMELGWAGDSWIGQGGPEMGKGLGGAVIASYHTNLATYATLFGVSFLTPVIWAFQSCLYSKLLLTLCPSPSTRFMLESQGFDGVRLWPRGVDLSQFGPRKRCPALRESWGITPTLPMITSEHLEKNIFSSKEQQSDLTIVTMSQQGLLTPPMTPCNGPVDGPPQQPQHGQDNHTVSAQQERPVILYVGRISWEKNLHLLLSAYSHIVSALRDTCSDSGSSWNSKIPKLVFVGDGPARLDLEERCKKEKWAAVFMGHRQGEELARCYASGDIFAFPSFTETFGQVVLEALASGLPVVGLDAEGTRDLVSHEATGLLLSHPASDLDRHGNRKEQPGLHWPDACNPSSKYFDGLARQYADLLMRLCQDVQLRRTMGKRASTEGIKGYTWWDAMEACVDGYRESMRMARSKRSLQVIPHSLSEEIADQNIPIIPAAKARRGLSLVNRVVSRRLAYRPYTTNAPSVGMRRRWRKGQANDGWLSLTTFLKIVMALCLMYALFAHHRAKLNKFMETEILAY